MSVLVTRKPARKAPQPAPLGLDGARVRTARERAGMTQMDLAYAIGADGGNVSAIETGRRDAQSTKVAALARALNVSADWLLGLTDDPQPHGRK